MRYGGVQTAAVLLLAFSLSFFAFETQASDIRIEPNRYELDTMLNEPRVLRMEVESSGDLSGIDLQAEGISIQREIKRLSPNRVRFLIEPDTSSAGRVSGSIAVVNRSGKALIKVPVTGNIEPYVQVAPSRLFLGSLEYGTKSDHVFEKHFRLLAGGTWAITDVNVSAIPGASSSVQEGADGGKELVVRFSENDLKEGEPFGAFFKRSIEIKTDLTDQPTVSIPVTAMLSRNGTARDFNTFLFKGNERWQGKWATPNIAAAVLGPLVLLSIGFGVWLVSFLGVSQTSGHRQDADDPRDFRRRQVRKRGIGILPMVLSIRRTDIIGLDCKRKLLCQIGGALLLACALMGVILLVKTYSRGGWIAFASGLLAMILLMRGYRWQLAAAGLVFLLVVAIFPAGVQRAASAGAVAEDGSIRNRLLVWRGAVEMIADHLGGVGPGKFGKVFADYYQEPWHKASYSTAINDYLTFAAEHGVAPVLAAGLAIALLGAVSCQLMRRQGDAWMAPVLSATIALGVSSFFSSIEFVREVRILATGLVTLIAIYCLVRCCLEWLRHARSDSRLSTVWLRGAAFMAVALGLVIGAAATANSARSVRHETGSIAGITRESLSTLSYSPSGQAARGTLIYLPQKAETLTVIGRRVLRPLAQQGWRAISLELPPYDQDAAAAVRNLVQTAGKSPCVILAEGQRARIALSVATDLTGDRVASLALIDPVAHSALSDCDRRAELGSLAGRIVRIDRAQWEAFGNNPEALGRTLSDLLSTPTKEPSISSITADAQILSTPKLATQHPL